MRKLFIPWVALVLGCALIAAGCDGSDGEKRLSSNWVTFEGHSISLDLPDSFKGGDPRDPDVLAVLEEIAARNPNPTFAENWKSWLGDMETDVAGVSTELVMWGEPNADGYMAMVTANRTKFATLGEWTSLQEFVESGTLLNHPPDYTWTVESLAENRAYVVVRDAYGKAPEEVQLYHEVSLIDGEYLYVVFYRFDVESNTALDAIFRASAETIMVRGYDEELPRSDAEGLGST